MPLADWDKNDAGNVALTPLVSLEVDLIAGSIVGLRLEMSQSPDRTHTDLLAVQTCMSAVQAQDLMASLHWAIGEILSPPPSGQAKN
jgi:hypothetical protein